MRKFTNEFWSQNFYKLCFFAEKQGGILLNTPNINFRIFFYAKIRQVARALFAQKPHAHYNAITIREDYKFYKLLSYYFDPLRSIKPPEEFRCTVIQSIQDYFVALQTGVEDESEFMRRVGQVWKILAIKIIYAANRLISDL